MTISLADKLDTVYQTKPKKLRIDELKWRYLLRSTYRGKNILLVGPTGCGKTLAAKSVVEAVGTEHVVEVDEDELIRMKADPTISIKKVEKM